MSDSDRMAKLIALAELGATRGERAAARAAIERVHAAERAETAELERLLGFGYRPTTHEETDEMRRAGNHI